MRPGGIKGIRDDTPDLLIWLRRLQTQRSVPVPGNGQFPVAIVDVKDVADFLVMSLDRSVYGTFNLAGRWMPFRSFLEGCKAATHSDADLVWIPEAFLQKQGLFPQSASNWLLNFPYCRPRETNVVAGVNGPISNQKAFDQGWQTRPLRDSAFDCLAYFASLKNYVFRDTLPAVRQEELLKLWRAKAH